MKIGIIGAGQIGGTLTRRLSALGHEVSVANSRSPDTLGDLARETGASPVSAGDAAHAGTLVVVTIPERNVPRLADAFHDVADDVVIVDTCNYYPRQRDGRIEDIERGTTESRWVERQLRHPVVKAFNNIRATHLMDLGRPKRDPHRIALPVAGDHRDGKAAVMRLVEELGFDAVDAGGLDDSWRQQPGSPVYVADLDAPGVRHALREASRDRVAAFRATAKSPGTFTQPA